MMAEPAANVPWHLEYYQYLLRLDRQGALLLAEQYLNEPGHSVVGLYTDVLMPALYHTGQEWEQDRISVAHEHYISEVTRDLIRRFGPRIWAEPDIEQPVAVACCAPGERHNLGLMMVSDLLRSWGLTVHYLGEGAPAEAVRDFVEQVEADLLCLSVALDLLVLDSKQMIDLVRSVRPEITILVGGAAFSGEAPRAHAIGADHFAADVRELGRLLPALKRKGPPHVQAASPNR